jgi:hypothetical protein
MMTDKPLCLTIADSESDGEDSLCPESSPPGLANEPETVESSDSSDSEDASSCSMIPRSVY